MNGFDCPTNGPGYYEPEGYEDACHEAYEQGAKSRDAEMRSVTDDLLNAQQEVERLTRLLCAAGLIEAA